MRELRIIVAGSRTFRDYSLLFDTISNFLFEDKIENTVDDPSQVKFISGGAKGADILGEQFAYNYGYDVKKFIPDWENLGKKAGYMRNIDMAKYAIEDGNYGALIAFWDGRSKGTKHMIDVANKYGLDVRVVNYEGE